MNTRHYPEEFDHRRALPLPAFIVLLVVLAAGANLFSLAYGTKRGYELGRAEAFAEAKAKQAACAAPVSTTPRCSECFKVCTRALNPPKGIPE